MWFPRLFKADDDNASSKMGDFALDEEVIRRLVERIIKLEVLHETLKRRVDSTFTGGDCNDFGEGAGNSRIMLWNRILRLEEGQQVVQKHIQELFANIMDFELQSRGEPCYLHDEGTSEDDSKAAKGQLRKIIRMSCKSSKIAGVEYVSRKYSFSIRVFWSLVLLLTVSVSAVLIYCSYHEWLQSPTVVSHDSPTALELIPFPAVTICPERNINSFYPVGRLMDSCVPGNCTVDKLEALTAASFLCPRLMSHSETWTNYLNVTSQRVVEEAMASCSEDISSFDWPSGAAENCTKAFQTLYIDNRVCYSFNLLPANGLFTKNGDPLLYRPAVLDNTILKVRPGWSPDLLSSTDTTDNSLPRHAAGAGRNYKLTITLQRKPFLQSNCTDHFENYQISVHHPSELPTSSRHHYLQLPLDHSLDIAVTPGRVVTLPPCVSQEDHPLQLYTHYTQANCYHECQVRCSVNLCGCVPFYFPRIDNSTKWCGHLHQYCPDTLVPDMLKGKISWESIAKFYRKEIRDDLHATISDHLYNLPGHEALTEDVLRRLAPDCSCQCPPACTQTSYHLETQLLPTGSWKNKSEVNVYFKEGLDFFTTTEQRKTFGFVDFIAHVGGVVALFTGLSVLTVVELMYLVTAGVRGWGGGGRPGTPEPSVCKARRQEWDKTAQTEPMFITNGTLTIGL